jgi:hypothetical protein
MERLRETVRWETRAGQSITVGDATLTPQSQALTLRWPTGGFVWNRPSAVWVERDGKTECIPIIDVTRVARWAMFGLSIVFVLISVLGTRRNRRDQDE